MKRHTVGFLLLLAVLILSPQALAAGSDRATINSQPSARSDTTHPTRTDNNQTAPAQEVARLKERGDREIARRIEGLDHLISKINRMQRLGADQKSDFTDEINQDISDLNNLKAKIDADTDLQTLKVDIKSIVDSYRIFALVMPQINIMDTAERMSEVAGQMSVFTDKLQARIAVAQQNGQDVAMLQSLLADAQAKIADAQTQAQNAENAVVNLTPDGYPGNRSNLENGWKYLKTAREDLGAALTDAKQIVEGLKTLETGGTGAATTGTV